MVSSLQFADRYPWSETRGSDGSLTISDRVPEATPRLAAAQSGDRLEHDAFPVINVWSPRALLPPLVLGGVLAVAAELAAGLLLYSGLGFLQALSVILAIEMGALGLGLWVASGISMPGYVDALRRQWLFLLFAFTAAAFYAAGWEILGGLSADPRTQGLGMALLAGLPLFAGGVLLGLLLREESGLAPPAGSLFPGPSVLVAFGAGAGFLLAGYFILRNVTPTFVFLGCIILISSSALIHGRILARRARALRRAMFATARALPPTTAGDEGGASLAGYSQGSRDARDLRDLRDSREDDYFAPFHQDNEGDGGGATAGATDIRAADPEAADAEPVEPDAANAEPVDPEPVDPEAADAEAVDAEAVDAEAADEAGSEPEDELHR